MNKKQQQDKQLLKNIDKAVAGEKLPEESGLDKDTKAALELSREMSILAEIAVQRIQSAAQSRIDPPAWSSSKNRTSQNSETRNTATFCAVRPGR